MFLVGFVASTNPFGLISSEKKDVFKNEVREEIFSQTAKEFP
jgi:hypothetical protein